MEQQITDGVDFLCVLGTTAETPCLTTDEKRQVMDVVKRVNNGRIPLLLGAGGNCTANVCRNLKELDLDGYSGVLIVCPYYNKPSQEGLYQHFREVAKASPVPVVLYNVPGRTGVNLEASTTLHIATDCPNVVAIKEASGHICQIEQIISHAPEGFEVLSGDDAITFELLTIGATGVISVIGNAYPKAFGHMVHSALQHDYNTSLTLHRKFSECFRLLSVNGNPAGIKALLGVQGKAANRLRLPLSVHRRLRRKRCASSTATSDRQHQDTYEKNTEMNNALKAMQPCSRPTCRGDSCHHGKNCNGHRHNLPACAYRPSHHGGHVPVLARILLHARRTCQPPRPRTTFRCVTPRHRVQSGQFHLRRIAHFTS